MRKITWEKHVIFSPGMSWKPETWVLALIWFGKIKTTAVGKSKVNLFYLILNLKFFIAERVHTDIMYL